MAKHLPNNKGGTCDDGLLLRLAGKQIILEAGRDLGSKAEMMSKPTLTPGVVCEGWCLDLAK